MSIGLFHAGSPSSEEEIVRQNHAYLQLLEVVHSGVVNRGWHRPYSHVNIYSLQVGTAENGAKGV